MTMLAGLEMSPSLLKKLAGELDLPVLEIETGHYPDGESRFRLLDDVAGQRIVLLGNLHHPDRHALPLILLAETLRDLGAKEIILLAPYLSYMRQDKRFRDGEGITSRYFAKLLSGYFDGLITIDPHLHRYASLDEIYSIKSRVLHAAPVLADWVAREVDKPLLIGPDAESEQWVSQVAKGADAPFVVAEKIRHGDRSVEVHLPALSQWRDHTPVLVDDIISSGRTMIEAARALQAAGMPPAICVGVHAVFSDEDYHALQTKVAEVVTTDAIPHESNRISVAGLLAAGLRDTF